MIVYSDLKTRSMLPGSKEVSKESSSGYSTRIAPEARRYISVSEKKATVRFITIMSVPNRFTTDGFKVRGSTTSQQGDRPCPFFLPSPQIGMEHLGTGPAFDLSGPLDVISYLS